MGTALRRASSRLFGWLADRQLPRPLRAPLYRAYARAYRVELDELRLALADHPSFGAFFVRRLREGARELPDDPGLLPAPCDGRLQALDRIEQGSVLQAKGRPYPIAELLGPGAASFDLEGGHAWTIYLSPRDYHRVHSPVAGRLTSVAWLPGELFSVGPRVLARREKVLSINERAVLRLETEGLALALVMVGALNVGRIRVVGVQTGADVAPDGGPTLERGGELARFEMGSTVVLLTPPGSWEPLAGLQPGAPLRLGQPIGARADTQTTSQ
jgi:phosphatidylserine decarboxylase